MALVEWVLVFATLASLVADLVAIIKGKKVQGVIFLLVFATLVAGLALQARHTARVEAENRALTDAQARAQKLVDLWTNSDQGFSEDFVGEGEAEGIAIAAADLLEDVKECRPTAHESALQRVTEARRRSAGHEGDDLDAKLARLEVWQEAAAAAFEQVRSMAEVAPQC